MFVLAVTGGIGSGKSTASALFAARGAIVLDLDAIAKGLLGPGMPIFDLVVAEFGPEIIGTGGRISHAALAEAAFDSPADARRLDAIVHPAVHLAVAGALDALVLQDNAPRVVVLDVPLLAEAPEFLDLVDAVLVISTHEDARMDRLVARGMPENEAERRMTCQASDAERRDIADYVIENDRSEVAFRAALADFWDEEVAPRVA
jgi:dephospho-CoA kinase